MDHRESKGDSMLGLAFNIGFLVMIVGALVYLIPLWDKVMLPIMNLLDVWAFISVMPAWMQIVMVGLALALSAVIIGTVKEFTASMIEELFKGREDY
ncbi:MAG: hypothetical protein NTU61_00030 [Candidatus Altiarchaeota archaeon]|nr:hypothetical protein [Candidatus Altiarchaeota archaeon]